MPELREFDGVQLITGQTDVRTVSVMPLHYANLDERTRLLMLQEVEADISDSTLYTSPRLNGHGRECYSSLLREAVQLRDDQWLGWQLRVERCLKQTESRRTKTKGVIAVDVPVTAPETLADGEFNAFYVRAVCRRAIEDGLATVQVYRGKAVVEPRPDSQAKIGMLVDAQILLTDLRISKGVDSALGIPAGPNSGLTARLPTRAAG